MSMLLVSGGHTNYQIVATKGHCLIVGVFTALGLASAIASCYAVRARTRPGLVPVEPFVMVCPALPLKELTPTDGSAQRKGQGKGREGRHISSYLYYYTCINTN